MEKNYEATYRDFFKKKSAMKHKIKNRETKQKGDNLQVKVIIYKPT